MTQNILNNEDTFKANVLFTAKNHNVLNNIKLINKFIFLSTTNLILIFFLFVNTYAYNRDIYT